MTCKVCVAFVDGSYIEEEIPNHEVADYHVIALDADKELYVGIEIENSSNQVIYSYRRKTIYAY